MAGTYIKPHRTYEEQLKLLQGRGLEVSDEGAALRLLRKVGSDLLHLANQVPTDKVYSSLAVSAYLLRQIDPGNNWPCTLMTQVRKFPVETGMSPVNSMGFPVGWDGQALWNAR